MDARAHWDSVYASKAANAVSWYRRHLDKSLALIERSVPERSASIIDVGGGEYESLNPYSAAALMNPRQTRVRRRLGNRGTGEIPR